MAKPSTLKDHFREGRIFNQRSLIAFAFVICLTMILIARMIFLQVAEYDKYSAQSDENRVSVEPIAPTRGLIFDRSGTLLADNQPTYSVSLLKERVPDIDASNRYDRPHDLASVLPHHPSVLAPTTLRRIHHQ